MAWGNLIYCQVNRLFFSSSRFVHSLGHEREMPNSLCLHLHEQIRLYTSSELDSWAVAVMKCEVLVTA